MGTVRLGGGGNESNFSFSMRGADGPIGGGVFLRSPGGGRPFLEASLFLYVLYPALESAFVPLPIPLAVAIPADLMVFLFSDQKDIF